MIIAEVNALLDLSTKAINLVQSVGSGCYTNSQDIESFAEQVQLLGRKKNTWTRLLNRYGPAAQESVGPVLESAIETLEREVVSMRHMQARWWRRWTYRTLSVGDASRAIQSVAQAFEEIPRTIQEYREADRNLNAVATNFLATLPFWLDNKYVPLLETLEAVQGALENVWGPPVVTLYGQPGSGKTVMAKYLAVYYDELRRQQEQQQQVLGDQGAASQGNYFPDGVFFLACGPEATSKELHEELWQNLGFRAIFDLDTQQGTNLVHRFDQDWYSESMLHKQLMGRLVGSSMLIILDDVWETKILERVLLPGRNLKYLVTSQDKRVWEDAVQINIAKPSLKDARQILLNHVGLSTDGKEIPPNLQDVADDIIRASEFNPLVLANLALTISIERATNVDEWITVRKYFHELLDDDDKAPVGFKTTYPQSVAKTMTMAVNSMAVEAKTLLFLAAVCDGPSVPEIVLKIFFKKLVGSLARFQKWSNYLEDRDFIQIQTQVVEWTNVPQKTWSLHLLRQHFVREKKKDDVSSMISVLLSAKDKDLDIVSALYILFAAKLYNQQHSARLSELLSISRETIDESFPRSSIKPFVWLLHVDSDEEWELNAFEMAKKIIVIYVRQGDLEDTGLSSLLQIPQAQPATCWALESIARLEQRALLTEKHEASLESLLALLDRKADPKIQSWGAVVLGALAVKHHEIILAKPLALKNLLGLVNLAVFDDANVQVYAAWTLGNLAATSNSKDVIASYPRMLESILKLLDRYDNLDVQLEAAYALRRLAYGDEIVTEGQSRQKIMISLPNMLEKLVELLSRGTDPDVQKEVVWLLGNLAASREEKTIIGKYPGVLNGLVVMLNSQDTRFDTQRYHAAYALRRLTLKEELNPKLGRIPGAMDCLVDLLFDYGKADVQKEAVHCLSFLAYPKENRISVATIPGAFEGLVGLLLKPVSPTTQLIAIGTLANLMEDLMEAVGNKLLISSELGALDGIVRMLTNTGTPPEVHSQLSEAAAQCLGQLSFQNYENQLTIASFPGALEGLVELLCWRNNKVQLLAVLTLSNLAEAEENRNKIRDLPRAVSSLTKLLENESLDGEIQGYAENALTLVLNSVAAPKKAPLVTTRVGSSPTDNEAIEDLEKHRG